MGHPNRRIFLEEIIATQMSSKAVTEDDEIFKKYANKTLPTGYKSTSTLAEYSGPWTETQVRHLLRRAMFGVKESDLQTLLGMTMSDAVDHLLNNIPAPPSPPLNNYNNSYPDPTGVPEGATWVNAMYGDGNVNMKRTESYKAWWMGVAINQNLSILEKMVFFWHNHFATQTGVVKDARLCYQHNVLLRTNALGNFREFTKLITKNSAMLIYLNGNENTRTKPDENYGRELQELFTVSKYNTPNYTEDDVKAAARVLTGWQVNESTLESFFVPSRHDTTDKTFSSFYNNTVIKGQNGSSGGNEIDDLINMICSKTETAHYICTKLYRFFVYYNIDTTIENNIIAGLTRIFVDNNLEIKPVLQALLKSQHFYDPNNIGCYIKTPLDILAGMFRTFDIKLPATLNVEKTYDIWYYLCTLGNYQGLFLGDPPNVSGWPAYYQSPEYYELWINSSTLPNRMEFTDMMLSSGFTAGTDTTIKADVLTFAKQYSNVSDPNQLVDHFVTLLLGVPVSSQEHDNLKSILLSGQTNNGYWTDAWNNYISNPDIANTDVVSNRLNTLLTTMLRLPEYQLC